MANNRERIVKTRKTAVYRLAGALMLWTLLTPPSHSLSRAGQRQDTGPSFPCEKATTSAEKLICADPDLAALDVEYSSLYQQRLRENTKAESDQIRSNARWYLQTREQCSNDKINAAQLRPYAVDCLKDWYYAGIAELSDLPESPPGEWSPRLVAGVHILISRNRGLERTRAQKPAGESYLKAPGTDKFIRVRPQDVRPARVDRSEAYWVYRNVLGSLTVVTEHRNDGNLDLFYFFNSDGRLAVQQRRFSAPSGNKPYGEYETVYYADAGTESSRVQRAYYEGKITTLRKDLSPPPLQKAAFDSLQDLVDARLQTAQALDPDQLGLCYLDLSDGYGPQTRILNFDPEPLTVFERSIPKMDYASLDNSGATPGQARGSSKLVGTLNGKRVYSVRYPVGFLALLVEREAARYLPVLIVSTRIPFDRLGILRMEGAEVLAYSVTIPGTGHLTTEWYFILDRAVSRRVDYMPVLTAELKRILPEHLGLRKGGGFDPDTLVFSHQVWRDDNASCCPAGGSVQVVLGFKNGEFFVKSSRFEASK
jgi:uncharacterized protein